ncbi:MAG: sigma-70 family RNA polymerase sigma factor, partial [Tistlia sp.]
PGTNLRAWLFTILRNSFYSQLRKRRREVEDVDGVHSGALFVVANQVEHIRMREFQNALGKLPEEQREALIMVGAAGYSYEETAQICGCAVGTVKSRVNRARRKLAALLGEDLAASGAPE